MPITIDQLKKIVPHLPRNADVFLPYLNQALVKFGIDTPQRIACFIAQTAHESMGFTRTQEIASGKAYEGRADLGNNFAGDGVKYKGRGFLQCTGRANYLAMGKALGLDLVAYPQLLETPQYACLSAGQFWHDRQLNKFADLPDSWRSPNKKYSPFQYITYRINGGQNGYAERLAIYTRAKEILNA